ncbi:DUF1573 domain-containing protein [Singulisphaera sp. Ch08]|uniref:DUF1573 domain-containing protein n=1 Tax=Singulisphaera sp. Ch08 TaxID=3120278 RepID=A0AAU7CQJ3_9BACT
MHHQWIKTALKAVILIGVTAIPASAATWADPLFAEQGHDFGPVPRGGKVRHNFLMTNRLNEAVTIANVRASCGCTSGKASTSLVQPGQSAVIEAEMDTRNFVGLKATTLFVSLISASRGEAEVSLAVSSLILSDVVLNPGSIDFGSVARGQTPSQTLTLDRIGSANWRVERMISASRVLNATLTETARHESTVSYALTVSLKPDAAPGVVRDEIRLLTNDKETANIPILVTALVRGDLTARPSVVPLGTVHSPSGGQGRFLVMSSKPFSIVEIEGAGDGFQLGPIPKERKPVHVVTFNYKPEEGKTRGDLRHIFRVKTDLPGEGPLDVTATLHIDP